MGKPAKPLTNAILALAMTFATTPLVPIASLAAESESAEQISSSQTQEQGKQATLAETETTAAANLSPIATQTVAAAHSTTTTQNGVTFTVTWDDSPIDEATSFHVTQTGGSSEAEARMDVPTYWDTDNSQESVCDPSRDAWGSYRALDGDSCNFSFSLTASGTYRINFYFMDRPSGINYLRTTVTITVSDQARPSVTQIANSAVAQCRKETDGSEYAMALWLHDWTLDQLEYDRSLNYCSAESGLTRGLGTCESYQRIYAKLLNAAGIANGRMEGNGHTWNAVKIDGKWCQMDLTWDDTSDNWYGDLDQRHLYFGLTDELMAIAHSDHTKNYQADGYAYRSEDLSNNYFVRNGKAAEWAEKYADRIQRHLDAHETEFSIDADNGSFPPSILGIQNGIIAFTMNQQEWRAASEKCELIATSNVTTPSSTQWAARYSFAAKYPNDRNPVFVVAAASNLDDLGYSTFTCSVTGSNADIAYQWQWSGDNGAIWIDSGPNYQTSSTRCAYAKRKEGLLFRCSATVAGHSTMYSNAISIPLPILPSVAIATSEIDPGRVAQFKCAVTNCNEGEASYQWQWSKDGGINWIDSGTAFRDATASITHTSAKDGLFFRCAVTVNGQRFYSNALTFVIRNTLTASASVRLEDCSSSNQLRCSATGASNLSYQWQWSGDGGATWIESGKSFRSNIAMVEYAPRKETLLFRCRVSGASNRTAYTNAVRLIH